MSNIILDCDQMRHKHTGLYYYCLNLGLYIQKVIDRKKDKMSFFVPSAEDAAAFGKVANTIIEKKRHKKFPVQPFLWGCDIWHTPFQSDRMFPVKSKRIKKLLTIHDLNALHEPITEEDKIRNLAHTQRLIDHHDCIVCISNHTKNDVMNHMNIHGKPIHVIHNGAHDVAIPPAKPTGYHPSRPFLFTMGYVNRKKNFLTLIQLLPGTSFELIVAGKEDDPDYISRMKEEASHLGVSDQLKILGPVPEGDKAWYFNHCEAFLFPSLAEGFGAPAVEAMGFGKPLFLSDKTSLPEIGGDIAFYFKNFEAEHMRSVFNEGMKIYRENPSLKEKIKSRAKDFNWETNAKKYLEVYHSML